MGFAYILASCHTAHCSCCPSLAFRSSQALFLCLTIPVVSTFLYFLSFVYYFSIKVSLFLKITVLLCLCFVLFYFEFDS